MLNYIKINAILWGCLQEQQNKIEHLETRLFEVENFIKDYVKPKPKTKAKKQKQKNKIKDINIIMGNKPSAVKNDCIEELTNIVNYKRRRFRHRQC